MDRDDEDAEPVLALVADDNALNRRMMGALLRAFGFAVEFAGDGVEALACIEARPYGLVLLDIAMPRMNGRETIAAIRARTDTRRDTPVVAVTASAEPEEEAAYYAAGFDGLVVKPIDPALFYAAIAAALDRCPPRVAVAI